MLLFLVPLHCIVTGHGWPICLLDVTITSLKMTLGLCRTRYDEIWNYLKRKEARVVGLGRLVRGIKKETGWRYAFVHPDNTFVHLTSKKCGMLSIDTIRE